jgi:hypothetical protein
MITNDLYHDPDINLAAPQASQDRHGAVRPPMRIFARAPGRAQMTAPPRLFCDELAILGMD